MGSYISLNSECSYANTWWDCMAIHHPLRYLQCENFLALGTFFPMGLQTPPGNKPGILSPLSSQLAILRWIPLGLLTIIWQHERGQRRALATGYRSVFSTLSMVTILPEYIDPVSGQWHRSNTAPCYAKHNIAVDPLICVAVGCHYGSTNQRKQIWCKYEVQTWILAPH